MIGMIGPLSIRIKLVEMLNIMATVAVPDYIILPIATKQHLQYLPPFTSQSFQRALDTYPSSQ
jgi:hypothetical protein